MFTSDAACNTHILLMAFNDAVKEGDGQQLYELYKLCLLIFKSTGHSKYSYVVLHHLVKLTCLSSRLRHID